MNRIGTVLKGRADRLLVVCASFEQRCTALADRFEDSYRCETSVIVDYGSVLEGRGRIGDGHAASVWDSRLQALCSTPVIRVSCNRADPSGGVAELSRRLRPVMGGASGGPVTLDITSLTKQYQLLLLRLVESVLGLSPVQVVYTPAGQYKPRMLTKGVRQIGVVPGFEGEFSPRKKKALITFLGFDRDRALCVWNAIEPERTIPIIGVDEARPGWVEKALAHNASLLRRPGVDQPIELPCYDPFAVWAGLTAVYFELARNHNVFVMPLGTKPQVLGLYLLAVRTLANLRVIYPLAGEYTTNYLDRGEGDTLSFVV
jgi:hypothetical protein